MRWLVKRLVFCVAYVFFWLADWYTALIDRDR
jgi:hypothetical protein